MKTFVPKVMNGGDRKWYVIDAKDQVLGKLAVIIANVLRGKNKTVFTPHLDLGDYIIVKNVNQIKLTGKKMEDKIYYSHSGYIGHLKKTKAKDLIEKKPEEVLRLAIKGMIPRNKLRKSMLTRLKLVVGAEHQYEAQKPEVLTV